MGLNRLLALVQPPFTTLDCSYSRQDCKSRRSTLTGQAAEVKGRELTLMAYSHDGAPVTTLQFIPTGQVLGTAGESQGVSGIEVTHLQGDTCTSPLLRPLYSQPYEG